jgi:hypothetical protein
MAARMMRWIAAGSVTEEDLFETVIEPLVNAFSPSRFRF